MDILAGGSKECTRGIFWLMVAKNAQEGYFSW
jgi:hypothetical protein